MARRFTMKLSPGCWEKARSLLEHSTSWACSGTLGRQEEPRLSHSQRSLGLIPWKPLVPAAANHSCGQIDWVSFAVIIVCSDHLHCVGLCCWDALPVWAPQPSVSFSSQPLNNLPTPDPSDIQGGVQNGHWDIVGQDQHPLWRCQAWYEPSLGREGGSAPAGEQHISHKQTLQPLQLWFPRSAASGRSLVLRSKDLALTVGRSLHPDCFPLWELLLLVGGCHFPLCVV